jgi:uncharacterized repeat protein (TIGR01451 family)
MMLPMTKTYTLAFSLVALLALSVPVFADASTSCPLASPTVYTMRSVTPGSSITIDLTDIGGSAGFLDTIGYYFADASHRPISGAIVFPNVQNLSGQTHQILTPAAPPNAAYVGLFEVADGGHLISGAIPGTPVSFTYTNSQWETVVGSAVYPGTVFGDVSINPQGRTYEIDSLAVPGNSNWDDNLGADQDYNDAQIDVHFYICPPPPVVPSFGAYCGDGVVNQAWEQCDGGASCTAQCLPKNSTQCTDIVLAKVTLTNVQNFDTTPVPAPYVPPVQNPPASTGGGPVQIYNNNQTFLGTLHSALAFAGTGFERLFGTGIAYAGTFGNMTPTVFLGSASYAIPSGVWFALYANGLYVADPAIAGYADVPGLAVQRSQGTVRVQMYGNNAPYEFEHADGAIELSGAIVTSQTNDTGGNALENPTDGAKDLTDAGDEISVSGGVSNFWMTTGTANDGFYTNYTKTISCPAPILPTASITADPNPITAGDSSTLTWTSTDATACTGTGFSTGGATSGHVIVSPSSTTTYSVSCTGPGGSANDSTTLTVNPHQNPKSCTLTITKSVDTTSAAPGDTLTYTINFQNTGKADCTGGGIEITDAVNPGLTYVSETHSANITAGYGSYPVYKSSDRTLRWNGNVLSPNESGSITVKATVNVPSSCTTSVANTAKVSSYEYNNFGTWISSNEVDVAVAKDCTPPPPPMGCINVVKETFTPTGAALTPVAQFSFKLDGSTIAQNDSLGHANFANVSPGVHTVTEVPAGSTWTQLSVTPISGAVTVPGGSACATVVFKNQQVVPPAPKSCTLTITKSVDTTSAAPGDTLTYTINFQNTGKADCTGGGIEITDAVNPGLTYVSETHSANITAGYGSYPVYKSSDRTLRWNGNVLSPNESGSITVKATVNVPSSCTTSVANTAKVSSYEYNNFGTWISSNEVDVAVAKDCTPTTNAPTCNLVAQPGSLDAPGTATLGWHVNGNATSISIDHSVGLITPFNKLGSKDVTVSQTTTFTATVTGPGGSNTCDATVTVTPPTPPGPTCALAISSHAIDPGHAVVIGWTSSNATAGSIDHNVGNATPVSNGSTPQDTIFPSAATTYTGTFGNGIATTTCSVDVSINGGGGGGCNGNSCGGGGGGGGGLNQPNIVLYGTPGAQPLAFVSLSQVPYTGFAAGPLLTLLFWLAVALWSAGIAYVLMGRQSMRLIAAKVFSFAPAVVEYDEGAYAEDVALTRPNEPIVASTLAMPLTPAIRVMPMPAPAPVSAPAAAVNGIPELADVIETRAHAAGVLLSPEALTMAMALAVDRAETLRIFGDILNDAVKTVPREDGWILLSSDRFSEIVKKFSTTAPASASVIVTEPAYPATGAQEVLDDSAVSQLAKAIVSGNRETAFSLIRMAESAGTDPLPLVTGVATALDALYHARRSGTTATDLALSGKAAAVSDEALEKLVGIFTHALGAGYSSPYTGVKLALAQAFEVK